MCVRGCVRVCVCVRARVCVCVCVRVKISHFLIASHSSLVFGIGQVCMLTARGRARALPAIARGTRQAPGLLRLWLICSLWTLYAGSVGRR